MAPSENSLTLHATHDILSWLEERTDRTYAKSPSRINEGKQSGGFDVKHQTARAFHIQYKSIYNRRKTKFELHNGRKSIDNPYYQFKLDLNQHNTLLIHNEAIEHGFYGLPLITDASNLPETLSETLFIDVYAIEIATKYLYVSQSKSGQPRVYARTYEKYGKGAEFYEISNGIYTWSDLRTRLINSSLGFQIRNDSGFSQTYTERLIRQLMLAHIFDHDWNPRGFASDGGEREKELRTEIVNYLREFILNQQKKFNKYHEREYSNYEIPRQEYRDLLFDYAGSRYPSLEGVRNSRHIVGEEGSKVDILDPTCLEDITPNGADVDKASWANRL